MSERTPDAEGSFSPAARVDVTPTTSHLIPRKLEDLLRKSPEASFADLRDSFVKSAPSQTQELTDANRKSLRKTLDVRLSNLGNAYHNRRHALEVEERVVMLINGLVEGSNLLSDRERVLLVEAARRHDDEHSGSTYRQNENPELGKNLSNEEWAVLLLMADNEEAGSILSRKDLEFMEKQILATSFGQKSVPAGKESMKRDYEPQTATEKLIALADVGGFVKGWEDWVDESLRLLEEGPASAVPADVDAWLKTRAGFTVFYIKPLLMSVKDYLMHEVYKALESALTSIISKVEEIKNDPIQKAVCAARLDEIRKR